MKKILVVDDDEGILDALSFVLEDAGYDFETTPQGEKTFERISAFKPDLILLDVLLSGSDGRVICQQLKRDKKTYAIPIIMTSAHPSAKESTAQAGANAFLPKPFEVQELLNLIVKYTT